MKPTDIFSNRKFNFRPMCKNRSPCHVSAPRGARTGTQGLKGAYERSILPRELVEEIVIKCEEDGGIPPKDKSLGILPTVL
jgi:hypothetical protein